MRWYIKEWQTGRYLLKTGVRFTRLRTETGGFFGFHTKTVRFTHSKDEAHGFDREKHVINFIRRHFELKKMFDGKEVYYVQE